MSSFYQSYCLSECLVCDTTYCLYKRLKGINVALKLLNVETEKEKGIVQIFMHVLYFLSQK